MSTDVERDYVLGTHDEEIARLGLQHRVWRPSALDCWRRAGIAAGWRVMDIGAGPGYATVDLAEIVGPTGAVTAVERSARFLQTAASRCRQRNLSNVRLLELDLMAEALQVDPQDAVWCRWVASFVSSPERLVDRIAGVLRPGGVAIFHEYVDYATWRLAPRRPAFEDFVRQVMATWRASGGEPDVAPLLLTLLGERGFTIREMTPIVYCVRRQDDIWQWPAAFLESGLKRLVELQQADPAWADEVRREFHAAEADPITAMVTPMVLEVIAERERRSSRAPPASTAAP
jgi:ubiquinone/menaquinone biosynthesis C-methylase UbiE